VTAPYAAFLALAVDPRGAVNDLRLFERCGALGRLGFYEALDFTPERCREEDGERVRCTMAHHAGMSLLAAANALCDGLVRRWFLLDPAMAAFQPLLRERLPDGAAVLCRDLTRAPEKPPRLPDRRWSVQGGAEDWDERRCLLTNGNYELLLSSEGRTHAACRGRTVYGSPTLEENGPRLELLWAGARRALLSGAERWELSENRGLWTWERDGLLCTVEISAAAVEPGEARRLRLHALRSGGGELTFSLRPILARWTDYAAHPAYWELGIETGRA
jgi:cyclic beta-1,2-glucan synthetase